MSVCVCVSVFVYIACTLFILCTRDVKCVKQFDLVIRSDLERFFFLSKWISFFLSVYILYSGCVGRVANQNRFRTSIISLGGTTHCVLYLLKSYGKTWIHVTHTTIMHVRPFLFYDYLYVIFFCID